jgi:hypothetical protein
MSWLRIHGREFFFYKWMEVKSVVGCWGTRELRILKNRIWYKEPGPGMHAPERADSLSMAGSEYQQ